MKIDYTHLAQDIDADMEPHGGSKPSREDYSSSEVTETIGDQEKRFPANNLARLFKLGRQGQSDEGQGYVKDKRFTMNYMDLVNAKNGGRQY